MAGLILGFGILLVLVVLIGILLYRRLKKAKKSKERLHSAPTSATASIDNQPFGGKRDSYYYDSAIILTPTLPNAENDKARQTEYLDDLLGNRDVQTTITVPKQTLRVVNADVQNDDD